MDGWRRKRGSSMYISFRYHYVIIWATAYVHVGDIFSSELLIARGGGCKGEVVYYFSSGSIPRANSTNTSLTVDWNVSPR